MSLEKLWKEGVGWSLCELDMERLEVVNRPTNGRFEPFLELFRLGPLSIEQKARKTHRVTRLEKNRADLVQPQQVNIARSRQFHSWLLEVF